ncbi:unnamed protein product [Mucor circinelloides]
MDTLEDVADSVLPVLFLFRSRVISVADMLLKELEKKPADVRGSSRSKIPKEPCQLQSILSKGYMVHPSRQVSLTTSTQLIWFRSTQTGKFYYNLGISNTFIKKAGSTFKLIK